MSSSFFLNENVFEVKFIASLVVNQQEVRGREKFPGWEKKCGKMINKRMCFMNRKK